MLKIFVIVAVVMGLISLLVIYYEIKHAIEVPPEEPFLYGDYEGNNT